MNNAAKPIGVFIVDDSTECTDHVTQLLSALPAFKLCGVAHTRRAAAEHIDDPAIDVFLIDLGLPDGSGVELIQCLHQKRPGVGVIVITVFADDEHVIQSIRAGAAGYLLKDFSADDLLNGIQMMRDGGSPISPTIARRVLSLWQTHDQHATEKPLKPLTPRELEVLKLIAKGNSLEEVAGAINLTRATVATHVRTIYAKLEVNSRGGAIIKGVKCGLIDTQ